MRQEFFFASYLDVCLDMRIYFFGKLRVRGREREKFLEPFYLTRTIDSNISPSFVYSFVKSNTLRPLLLNFRRMFVFGNEWNAMDLIGLDLTTMEDTTPKYVHRFYPLSVCVVSSMATACVGKKKWTDRAKNS